MTLHGNVTQGPDDHFEREDPITVMLTTCDGCGGVNVLAQTHFAGLDTDPEPVWPTAFRSIPPEVPTRVRRDLLEARRCFELAHAPAATAVMARRVVEQVCKHHGVNGGTLVKKLDAMRASGTIDGRLHDWATSLRFLGNDGAHGDNVNRQDAEDGLTLAEALVEYVYVLTAKHRAFEQRRAAKRNVPPTSALAQPPGGTDVPLP
ncbi:DUF4145 domain-containing protein [Kitasatospora cineracea]|uniref:DUF4145 domain-containing protein n=1 Tax=Kitasatospora cineracea TaxID=88074 RepID=UPI0036AE2C81